MKATTNQFLKDKLAQYQNGELSPEEREIIDNWFDTNLPAAQNEASEHEFYKNQLYLELLKPLKAAVAKEKTRHYKMPQLWLKVACSIILLAAISFFTYNKVKDHQLNASPSYQTFGAQKGKVETVILPDGTKIWMNAGTSIRIASNFNTAQFRKIYLDEGEAFFKVKRDTLRPFSIATKKMLTTVLGTSFNIKAYPESNVYQVAVATGKVKVAQQTGNQLKVLSKGLIKGEVLTQQLTTNTTIINRQDIALISNWKTNRSMYIDNLTLRQIGAELSRQYAIDVKVNPGSVPNKVYSIHLQHQDLKIVLQQLAMATGINYQLTKSQLTLNPPQQ